MYRRCLKLFLPKTPSQPAFGGDDDDNNVDCSQEQVSFVLAPCSVADLYSRILDAPPPRSNFLHFHAVFGLFLPNNGLASPVSGCPPPENPGSAGFFTAELLSKIQNIFVMARSSILELYCIFEKPLQYRTKHKKQTIQNKTN